MRLEQFLERLEYVRGAMGAYTARCPAHDDRSPSLSVAQGEEGRILVTCHAGCEYSDIVAAMGLEVADLFAGEAHPICGTENMISTETETRTVKVIEPEIVNGLCSDLSERARTYLIGKRFLSDEVIDQYRLGLEHGDNERRITIPIYDQAGRCVDIRRWLPPKWRNGGQKAKMLHWKTGYAAKRLFPLQSLGNDRIVMVEGELDALALIANEIPAVTVTGGAKVVPDSDWLSLLLGKEIILLMDNDQAGRTGATARSEALLRARCPVKIAEWPEDRSEKWDCIDELRDYGAPSIIKIIGAAKEPLPPSEPEYGTEAVFPTQSLPGPLRRLAEEGGRSMQCAPELIAVPLLTAAGAAIGTACCLSVKDGWDEYPALYSAQVTRPGSGKSKAMAIATEFVRKKEADPKRLGPNSFEKQAGDGVGLAASVAKGGDDSNQPRFTVTDVTVEALVPLLMENPRGLLLVRDELSAFAESMNVYRAGRGGDRQFFLSVWQGTAVTVDRKKDHERLRIERPFLAITGTIQPDCLSSLGHKSKREDGLLDRFLYFMPDDERDRSWTEDVPLSSVAYRTTPTYPTPSAPRYKPPLPPPSASDLRHVYSPMFSVFSVH